MKIKVIAVLCILSVLLSLLVGCSVPGGGNGGGNTNGEGDLTHDTKNRLTLAKELADEVDNVQTLSSVILGKNDTTRKNLAVSGKSKGHIVPLSSLHLESRTLVRDENALDKSLGATSFEWADEIVEELKREKDQALSVCNCLNTWVKIGDGPYSAVYRMNYDTNTDTVTVEYHSHPSDYNSYRRFTVTLDAEGRAVIDSYSASYTAERIESSTELHYYEDKYYFSLSMHRSEEGDAFENTMFLDLSNKVQAYIGMNSTTYYENGVPVRTEYEDPVINFEYTDGDYVVKAGKNGGSLAYIPEEGYASGGEIGSYNTDDILINLNIFDGWTTVSRDGDYITLNTDKGSFQSLGFTYNYLGEQDGVSYSYFIPYYEGYATANLWMKFGSTHAVSAKDKIRGAFIVLARELGLTIDETLMEKFVSVSDRYDELSEAFHFKSGVYAKDITTPDDYFMLIDMMRTREMTLDELGAVYDGSGINQNDQPIENTYFEFLSATLSGRASIAADTGDLSLVNISAEMRSSLLMKEGGTYSLVFAWSAPGVIYEVGSVSVTYEGEEALRFTSELNVMFSAFPKDFGEYRLVAFVAMDRENRHDRISQLFDIGADGATFTNEYASVKSALTATSEAVTLVNTIVSAEPTTPEG